MSLEPSNSPLHPADADALDALVDAGFDCERVAPFLRDRARRVATMLGMLDDPADQTPGHEQRAALIDCTMERAVRTPMTPLVAPELALCDGDAAAVDALVGAGWDAARVPAACAARSERVAGLLALLDAPAATRGKSDLIASTMNLVRLDRDRRERARRSAAAGSIAGRTGGFRLSDLVSVAAMLFIGASILWPVLGASRESARQAGCEANMQNAGLGFSLYAGDHRGALPRTPSSQTGVSPGARWWNVGDPEHSHSANLFTLITGGYATLGELSCPGNAEAPINLDVRGMQDWRTNREVSFSYQLFSDNRPMWKDSLRVVVIVDRSPLIERARRGEALDPEARSLNHGARGQNVLFNDGSVVWLVRPELANGDNIWLPRSATGRPGATLRGVERPDGRDDAFVGP